MVGAVYMDDITELIERNHKEALDAVLTKNKIRVVGVAALTQLAMALNHHCHDDEVGLCEEFVRLKTEALRAYVEQSRLHYDNVKMSCFEHQGILLNS